jgi:MoaA/NifB/PqqE/SkfB family radical SAM enzyme
MSGSVGALHGAKNSARAAAFYPEVPPISLELTSKCNLKCPYCTNAVLPRQQAEPYISWALLEKLVDECADGRHNLAQLHGTGEPLLWDRLEEAVTLIKSRRAGDASFATNGTLLTERRIASLLEAGLTSLRVSLDSLDERIYAATRGARLSKTIANIKNLIRVAPADFSLTIILMNHKDQEIQARDVARFYELFGVSPGVRLEIVENGIMVDATSDFRRYQVQVESCWRSSDWFTITYQGLVSLCCTDQVAAHVLGDVTRQTIDEIWYDERNQSTFRNIAAGVGACPQTCTKHCYLKEPDPARSMDPSFVRPIDELLSVAEERLFAGEFTDARQLVRILLQRAPRNGKARRLDEILQEVLGQEEQNIYKAAAEERLALIQRLSDDLSKTQLRRKGRRIPFFRT